MTTVVIDLAKYTERDVGVLAGRPRGEHVRKEEHIDRLDATSDVTVEVHIPDWVFSVNSSFMLGMLGESVRRLGPEAFRAKYVFFGPDSDGIREDTVRKARLAANPLVRRTA